MSLLHLFLYIFNYVPISNKFSYAFTFYLDVDIYKSISFTLIAGQNFIMGLKHSLPAHIPPEGQNSCLHCGELYCTPLCIARGRAHV